LAQSGVVILLCWALWKPLSPAIMISVSNE
jgi:hypothetical protein